MYYLYFITYSRVFVIIKYFIKLKEMNEVVTLKVIIVLEFRFPDILLCRSRTGYGVNIPQTDYISLKIKGNIFILFNIRSSILTLFIASYVV